MNNKQAIIIFVGGLAFNFSIPFLIDVGKDGELGDNSLKEFTDALTEIDKVLIWIFLASNLVILLFICIPTLTEKIHPKVMGFMVFTGANAFGFALVQIIVISSQF